MRVTSAKETSGAIEEGSVIFDVRESGRSGAHAVQRRFAHSSVLSLEAFARSDAGVLSVIGPRVTTRIWFDGAETEHVDPAVEARHDRDDVDGIHMVAQKQAGGCCIIQLWRRRDVNNPTRSRHLINLATCCSHPAPLEA